DLDLSYRAQLAGWRMVYCEDEVCPAEIPADVNAIKAQQRRWAIGIMQVARKLLPRVLKSRRLSFAQKLQGVVHLTQYVVAVPMIGVALVGRLLPLLIPHWPGWLNWVCLSFLLAAAGPTLAYISARYVLGGGIPGPLRVLKLMVLGLGLCVNNGLAVLAGLRQKGGEFVRTPKSGRCHGPLPQAEAGLLPQAEAGLSTDRGGGSAYAALRSRLWLIELLLGTFCLAQWIVFLPSDKLGGVFLLMYAIGLFAMGWGSRPDYIRGQPACGTHGVSTALPAPPAPRLTPEPAHPDALAHGVST
ncbi:MAG: glycosyltransferase, partial [Planctomycetota bacterium]